MMNTAQLVKKPLNETSKHDLIRGDFSPEDALEIINHLISEKINFHGLRSFSNKIRFGEVDHHSERRIKELKKSSAELNSLIKMAKEEGLTLKIESTISIQFV